MKVILLRGLLVPCFIFSSVARSAESCQGFEDGFRAGAEQRTKVCSASSSKDCFSDASSARWPFRVINKNAKKVVVCAHGLADSPYYFKDLAKCMAAAGAEVWGIRLAGHDDSTSGENIVNGSWRQWKRQVCCAVQKVLASGRQPVLCGFSTGATIALVTALKQECGKVSGLMLFSPAIRYQSWILNKIVQTPLSKMLGRWNFRVPSFGRRKKSCARYDHMYSAGADYLNDGLKELHSITGAVDTAVFSYFSKDDRVVSVSSGIRFLNRRFTKTSHLVLESRTPERLRHSALFKERGCALPEEVHPGFETLCRRVREELSRLD